MKSKKHFFESVMNPGLVMNRFGVVFAHRSHSLAANELWLPDEWEHGPMERCDETRDIEDAVHQEAVDSGYTWKFAGAERVYSPAKE